MAVAPLRWLVASRGLTELGTCPRWWVGEFSTLGTFNQYLFECHGGGIDRPWRAHGAADKLANAFFEYGCAVPVRLAPSSICLASMFLGDMLCSTHKISYRLGRAADSWTRSTQTFCVQN